MAFKIRSAGILKELDRQDEVNRLTQKRQDDREKLYLSLAGPKSYSAGSLARSSSGKGSSTDSLDLSIKALQNPKGYNLGDDLLAPIIASGDPTGATKLLTVLDNAREKFENDGMTLPETVVKDIISSIITKQPTTKRIDMNKITQFIGREINEMYLPMLEEMNTIPGGVYVPDYNYVEQPTLDDLAKIPKLVAQNHIGKAEREISLINQAIATLADQQGTSSAPQDLEKQQGFLTERLASLNNAIKVVGDNPITLISLYGNSYGIELIEKMPKYEGAPLPEQLTSAMYSVPLVSSIGMGIALLKAGIFSEGTTVRLPSTREHPSGEQIKLELTRPTGN